MAGQTRGHLCVVQSERDHHEERTSLASCRYLLSTGELDVFLAAPCRRGLPRRAVWGFRLVSKSRLGCRGDFFPTNSNTNGALVGTKDCCGCVTEPCFGLQIRDCIAKGIPTVVRMSVAVSLSEKSNRALPLDIELCLQSRRACIDFAGCTHSRSRIHIMRQIPPRVRCPNLLRRHRPTYVIDLRAVFVVRILLTQFAANSRIGGGVTPNYGDGRKCRGAQRQSRSIVWVACRNSSATTKARR